MKGTKMPKFINISNHPSTKWGAKQYNTAKDMVYGGEIVDVQFPNIDPRMTELEIQLLVDKTIADLNVEPDDIIHVMGEMTFTFHLVSDLTALGNMCVASTTEREVVEHEDGSKTAQFNFVKFRMY